MNDVTLSGIINGKFEEYGDGVLCKVLVSSGNNYEDEFPCLAYGATGEFLKQRGQSGKRVVALARLGREKIDGENYQSALILTRILSVTESENGMDTSQIVVSGEGKVGEIRHVGDKDTPLVPVQLTNLRQFKPKSGDEVVTYKTFINGTAWTDRALALSARVGTEELPMVLTGSLRSRSYEDKSGNTVNTIDVWVQDVYEGTELTASTPRASASREKAPSGGRSAPQQRPPQKKRSAAADDDLPF